MSLKIVSASEPIRVEQIVIGVYSLPGIGKTTLANTAEAPLLIDFDNGAYRSGNRKDTVRPASWVDVINIQPEDLAAYKTIVVDTAGRALDSLSTDIMVRDPKKSRGGALTLQGYGSLKAEFSAWLKMVKACGKDVVLLAHMDEQRDGDNVIERLDVQGGSKGEIYKSSDAIAKLYISGKNRMLDFSPREGSLGKNPAQFNLLPVPLLSENGHYLADVIADIKARLNAFSEDQIAQQRLFSDWQAATEECMFADDFNRVISEIKKQPKPIQIMFNAAALARGFVFDKETKKYISPAVAA